PTQLGLCLQWMRHCGLCRTGHDGGRAVVKGDGSIGPVTRPYYTVRVASPGGPATFPVAQSQARLALVRCKLLPTGQLAFQLRICPDKSSCRKLTPLSLVSLSVAHNPSRLALTSLVERRASRSYPGPRCSRIGPDPSFSSF